MIQLLSQLLIKLLIQIIDQSANHLLSRP